jgi:hypothetical protein
MLTPGELLLAGEQTSIALVDRAAERPGLWKSRNARSSPAQMGMPGDRRRPDAPTFNLARRVQNDHIRKRGDEPVADGIPGHGPPLGREERKYRNARESVSWLRRTTSPPCS